MRIDAPTVERLIRDLLPVIKQKERNRAALLDRRLSTLRAGLADLRRSRLSRLGKGMLATLASLEDAVVTRQQRHGALSPDLNCWDVLGLVDSEVDHSLVLAWLLDRTGTHAQGSLFFAEFLGRIQSKVPLSIDCATERYRVATEVRHARSRIDIEVIGQTFILHIESKVNADEGEDQTCREREDLKAKAAARGIAADRACGIYLSARGDQCADQEKFRPLSWTTVTSSIEAMSAAVRATRPQNSHLPWVLDGYADVLRRSVVRIKTGTEREEETSGADSVRRS